MKQVLTATAGLESGTGLSLIIAPSVVAALSPQASWAGMGSPDGNWPRGRRVPQVHDFPLPVAADTGGRAGLSH